jgi:Rrf2 family iron-sulfur cluster assembly transcriptional regulator
MKLTTKGRYAVMAMADIAVNQKLKPVSLRDISLRQNISLSYLEQLFSKLKNRKLVKSVRGPLGGYILEKTPKDIKISNIIFAVDEEVKTLNCNRDSKKSCQGKSAKCITHHLWVDLEQHINDFFDSTNLGDLTKQKQSDSH